MCCWINPGALRHIFQILNDNSYRLWLDFKQIKWMCCIKYHACQKKQTFCHWVDYFADGLKTLMHNYGAADLHLFSFACARCIYGLVVFRFCLVTKIWQLIYSGSDRSLYCYADNCNGRRNRFSFFMELMETKMENHTWFPIYKIKSLIY